MLRLVFWFIVMAAAVAGITWLAEHPGTMTIDWLGWRVEDVPVALALGVLAVAVAVLLGLWRLIRMFLAAPGAARDYFRLRRRKKGLDALSQGLVALLAGNAAAARKAAGRAARLVPGEPVARLLEARAAQALGEEKDARRLLEEMLDDPSTEAAALHGLYEQAVKAGDMMAARQWAARAWKNHPDLPWAGRAMLRFLALDGEWHAVLRLLDELRHRGLMDKAEHARKKAAALTALALKLEETDPERAIALAQRAHKLDPSLIPAAVLAGGMLAARGKLRKAARILEKTWKLAPHPDIAEVYAHLRPGDSPRDRLKRVQNLIRLSGGGEEGAVALARAAMEAQDWETARGALRPWLNENPGARIYILMAELEEKAYGDRGRAREWLARAVRARRDPAWTAEGMVSAEWLPASPVTGELGVFEWRTPVKGDEHMVMPEPVPAELLEAPAIAASVADGEAARPALVSMAGAAAAGAAAMATEETAHGPAAAEDAATDSAAAKATVAAQASVIEGEMAAPAEDADAGEGEVSAGDVSTADAAEKGCESKTEALPVPETSASDAREGAVRKEEATTEIDAKRADAAETDGVNRTVTRSEVEVEETGGAKRAHPEEGMKDEERTEDKPDAGRAVPPPGAAPLAPKPDELKARLRPVPEPAGEQAEVPAEGPGTAERSTDGEAGGRASGNTMVASSEAPETGEKEAASEAASREAEGVPVHPAAEPVDETPEETYVQPPLPDDPGPLPADVDDMDEARPMPVEEDKAQGRRWRLFGR